MKHVTLVLIAVFFAFGSVLNAQDLRPERLNAAQVAQIDVTGKWIGKRSQFNWDRKTVAEVFEYEFDLKQDGDRVTGTTTIINSNGNYADMKIEGIIVGNKLHFAEKEVKSAIRPDGRVWCFKSGELYFTKDGNNIKLEGATPSYMENSNFPCSGGLTNLTKADNGNIDLSKLATPTSGGASASDGINIVAFPNPFIENSNIRYNITTDAKVKLEVYDITGKLVNRLFEGNQKSGVYTQDFQAKNYGFLSGIFIVKLTVNGEVFSKQLVQMR